MKFVKILICMMSAMLVSSCYTVEGAVKGAGKDVAVVAGPATDHHNAKHHDNWNGHKHKAKHHKKWKHTEVKKTNNGVKTDTTVKETTEQTNQSSSSSY